MTAKSAQTAMLRESGIEALTALYDLVPDTVFFVKDAAGRYLAVNQALADRVGKGDKRNLINKPAADLFHKSMAAHIAKQDADVLRGGKPVVANLELHVHADGREGWCLTWKQPVRNVAGQITGLVGISRDIDGPGPTRIAHGKLARALDHIQANLAGALRVPALARLAGLSAFQFDRRLRQIYGLSTRQYIIRARISEACSRLRTPQEAISAIALACGYSDQAAFTRQFRKSVGLTPAEYRRRHARD